MSSTGVKTFAFIGGPLVPAAMRGTRLDGLVHIADYYRTFLALAETLAKHMIMLKDATYTEIFAFLDAVDLCGKASPTKVQDHPDRPVDTEKCNVSFEARLIKKMYIRLQHA